MFIKRDNLLNTLIRYRHKDLVKIITGVRRCGKSILLNELFFTAICLMMEFKLTIS